MSKSRSILKKPAPLKAIHLDIPEEDDKTSGETAQSEESNEPKEGADKSEAENPAPPPPSAATSEGKKEGPGRKLKNKNLRAVDSIRVASDRLSSSPRSKFLKKRKQNETNSPRLTPRMGHIYEGGACFTFPDTQDVSSTVPTTSAYRKRSSPRPEEETHSSGDKVLEPTKSFDKNEDAEQIQPSEQTKDPKTIKPFDKVQDPETGKPLEKNEDPEQTKSSEKTKDPKTIKPSDEVEDPKAGKALDENKDSEPTQPSDNTDSVSKAVVPSLDSSAHQNQTFTNTVDAAAKSPAASVDVADDILTDKLIPSRESHDNVDKDAVVCDSTSEESAVESSKKLEEASLDHCEVLSPPVPMEDNDKSDTSEVVAEKPDKDEDQRQTITEERSRASESTDINMESVEDKLTSAANETIDSLKRLSATGSDMDYDDDESLV